MFYSNGRYYNNTNCSSVTHQTSKHGNDDDRTLKYRDRHKNVGRVKPVNGGLSIALLIKICPQINVMKLRLPRCNLIAVNHDVIEVN